MLSIFCAIVLGMVCVLLAGQYGMPQSERDGFWRRMKPLDEARRENRIRERVSQLQICYDGVRAGIEYIRQHEEDISFADAERLESRLMAVGGISAVCGADKIAMTADGCVGDESMIKQASLMGLVMQLVLKIKDK